MSTQNTATSHVADNKIINPLVIAVDRFLNSRSRGSKQESFWLAIIMEEAEVAHDPNSTTNTTNSSSEEAPFPIKGIRFQSGKWSYRHKKPPGAKTPIVPYHHLLREYCTFITSKINLPCCITDRGTPTIPPCTCLHFLRVHEDKERLVRHCANAILQNYAALPSNAAKDAHLLDMKRHSTSSHDRGGGRQTQQHSSLDVKWMFPQNPIVDGINENSSREGNDDAETIINNHHNNNNPHQENHFICLRAICMLFNLKRAGYDKLKKHTFACPPPGHKGVGNRNNSKNVDGALESLHEFFRDLKNHHADDRVSPMGIVERNRGDTAAASNHGDGNNSNGHREDGNINDDGNSNSDSERDIVMRNTDKATAHPPPQSQRHKTKQKSKNQNNSRETTMYYLLPSHYSKLQLYKKWCFRQGYIVTYINKSTNHMAKASEWQLRPRDDNNDGPWPMGSERKHVVSLRSFWRFWNNFYPFLKIRDRGKGTSDRRCNNTLSRTTKMLSHQRSERNRLLDESSSCSSSSRSSSSSSSGSGSGGAIVEAEFEQLVAGEAMTRIEAEIHIQQYRRMRETVKAELAKQNITPKKTFCWRIEQTK